MTDRRFRRATPADVRVLAELERAANVVALAHVFPPDDHAFPLEEVADRWAATLADPAVTVEVVDGDDGLQGYVAHDDVLLRHLAVHPSAWGRGLGRELVGRAVGRMGPHPTLWCLADNHRARALYEHLGWRATGVARQAVWPPHPTEVELRLVTAGSRTARPGWAQPQRA